jgi:hypothetical protein
MNIHRIKHRPRPFAQCLERLLPTRGPCGIPPNFRTTLIPRQERQCLVSKLNAELEGAVVRSASEHLDGAALGADLENDDWWDRATHGSRELKSSPHPSLADISLPVGQWRLSLL